MENLILNYKIVEAFWALADKMEDDLKCRKYFIRLVGLRNNVGLLRDEMDKIQALAEQGNPFMQYAFARYHDCLAPEKILLPSHGTTIARLSRLVSLMRAPTGLSSSEMATWTNLTSCATLRKWILHEKKAARRLSNSIFAISSLEMKA